MMLLKNIFKPVKVVLLLLFTFSFVYGCNESVKADITPRQEIKKPSASLINLLNNPAEKKAIKYKRIKVIEIEKSTEVTTDKPSKSCDKWKMSDEILRKILTISKPISEAEKNYLYDIKVCSYDLKLKFNNQVFLITTNGGGWTSIMNKAKTDYLLLGCNTKECKQYFISRGNRPDE